MANFNNKKSVWMSTKRIETLVDGVFAIALTLLVLNVDVPNIVGSVNDPVLWQYVANLGQQLWIYAFSFLLLASFWRANHLQFFYIKEADSNLIWITVLWLMFIALVPFSTNFVSNYGSHSIPMFFFNLNMLIIGIFYILIWTYVSKKNYFYETVDKKQLKLINRINYILPIVALVAIGVTFVKPSWSPYSYFLIFILRMNIKRI
jgi:uncharacterized membrane protein